MKWFDSVHTLTIDVPNLDLNLNAFMELVTKERNIDRYVNLNGGIFVHHLYEMLGLPKPDFEDYHIDAVTCEIDAFNNCYVFKYLTMDEFVKRWESKKKELISLYDGLDCAIPAVDKVMLGLNEMPSSEKIAEVSSIMDSIINEKRKGNSNG